MPPLTQEMWTQRTAPRSEVAIATSGVRLAIAVISLGVTALTVLVNVILGGLAPWQWAVTLLAFFLSVLGTLIRHSPVGPWLSLASIAVLLGLGLASPTGRVDLQVMATYSIIYLALLVTSRRAGLVWIGVGIGLMSVVIVRSPTRLDIGSWTVNVGWVAVLQMLVSGVWLWSAWHASMARARERDALAEAREESISALALLQDRTRAWREAVTRTHETILNDVRYVLHADALDRGQLRDQLLISRATRAQAPADESTIAAMVARLRTEVAVDVEVRGPAANQEVSAARTLQPVIAELLRNIDRHAGASRVIVDVEQVPGGLRLSIIHDGWSAGSPSARDTTPGIGRSMVVDESLRAMGAMVREGQQGVVIEIPSQGPPVGAGDAGRTLLLLSSIVLVSSAVGGSVQFLLMPVGASAWYLIPAVAACLLTGLAAVIVAQQRSVSGPPVAVACLLACIVTWGSAIAPLPCAQSALVLTTLNLSINALIALLLWSRRRTPWLLALPALLGVLVQQLIPSSECAIRSVDVLLSSAVLMPVMLFVSWVSARSAARWQETDMHRWQEEVIERNRATTAVDLAHALEGSVEQAWDIMWEIAEGADLDGDRRHRLMVLDGRIRACLQADPRASGGVVLAARDAVVAATGLGAAVRVRALRGSSDERPLPPALVDLLVAALSGDPVATPSIHAFFDGVDDYLTLTTTTRAATAAGLEAGAVLDPAGGESVIIEMETVAGAGEPDSEVTVILRRHARVADSATLSMMG